MRQMLLTALPVLLLPVFALAKAPLPATPPGRATAAYFEALQSNDKAKAAAFVKSRWPSAPGGAAGLADLARQTGGFEVLRLEETTQTAVIALVRERYGAMCWRIQVETEAAPPYRVRFIRARPIPTPPDVAVPARLSAPALSKAVQAKLGMMGDNFSGVVLLAQAGRPSFVYARGWADRERRIANGPTTRFRVGSMDKMFTAVAVLQLVQAGKVDLQAPLLTYLKDYPNGEWASKVTLHQLLTHTGGAGDFFGPEYEAHRDTLRTLADYVDLLGSRPPTSPPGTKLEYSNYGFILLGRVVEVVSGQSFYDYVQTQIFDRAGMTGSGFEPESEVVPDRAVAYERVGSGFLPARSLPWRGTSAGGGYSTAEDFLKFAAAFADGRLLDARHRALMTTAYHEETGDGEGYGFVIYSGAATPMIGHTGQAPGMSGDFRMTLDGKTVIVALTNVSPPFLAGRLTMFASQRLAAPKSSPSRTLQPRTPVAATGRF